MRWRDPTAHHALFFLEKVGRYMTYLHFFRTSTHKTGNLTVDPSGSFTFLPDITKPVGLYHHLQLQVIKPDFFDHSLGNSEQSDEPVKLH